MTGARSRSQAGQRNRQPGTRYTPQGRKPVRWEARYAPAPGLTWSVANGEAVISDPGTGRDYTLNSVGTAVWELLDGHRPLAAVPGALAESFDAPERRLRRDLLALVTQLRAEGLIEERR